MALLLQLGVAALVAWALWTVLRPRCAFVVRITAGVPRLERGTVSRSFLQDSAEICARHGVTNASVRGVIKGQHVTLVFAPGMPRACQQQLRNIWALTDGSTCAKAKPF